MVQWQEAEAAASLRVSVLMKTANVLRLAGVGTALWLLLGGCAAREGALGPEEARKLTDDADAATARRDPAEAARLRLICWERCSHIESLSMIASLRRDLASAPGLEPELWAAVSRIEDRLTHRSGCDEVLVDIDRLLGVYEAWNRPDRVRGMLKRVLKHGAPSVYGELLARAVVHYPSALGAASDLDVELLVEAVVKRPALHRVTAELMRMSRRSPAFVQRFLDDTRERDADDAVAFATFLLRVNREDGAKRLLRAAVQGADCRTVQDAIGRFDNQATLPLLQKECGAEPVH